MRRAMSSCPSQFYDRTSQRAEHTFFGGGIAAHISFAEPICYPAAQPSGGERQRR